MTESVSGASPRIWTESYRTANPTFPGGGEFKWDAGPAADGHVRRGTAGSSWSLRSRFQSQPAVGRLRRRPCAPRAELGRRLERVLLLTGRAPVSIRVAQLTTESASGVGRVRGVAVVGEGTIETRKVADLDAWAGAVADESYK
jgi:hypothetical protein